ncbi:hypothetical protein P168DRAFT_172049 [Aspergillus campestris IBT 28561]|uniref:Uncharacterized protein n=1 Tax=Aspergillus campestris (strain IBT 28561) TaxID=1392248 RepID=A0A2I1D252_ASPC2|nr:uncharacterized protein P168DRAFT_172049 [Aspergillus campestris IBT 28561]PKY03956.1 hypothetical protein P168DRAFT_172049 [Aspergillus campestris IBT 28561]
MSWFAGDRTHATQDEGLKKREKKIIEDEDEDEEKKQRGRKKRAETTACPSKHNRFSSPGALRRPGLFLKCLCVFASFGLSFFFFFRYAFSWAIGSAPL